MGILDKWLDDLPQQFQGKKHIEDLISVFAKQMEDLHRVFKQLDAETDLESAVGANLDMVGDIVTLTRKEADRKSTRLNSSHSSQSRMPSSA